MDDEPEQQAGTGPATQPDEPALIVELTPRDYRRRSWFALGVGSVLIVLTVVGIVQDDQRLLNPIYGLALLVYGLYCLRRARQQVTELVLRIDRAGIRTGDGTYDRRWDGVIMVWVGSQSGFRSPFVWQPVISVFTLSGLDFARRAGVRPSPLYTVPIGGGHRVRTLCRRLQALTSADVVDGTLVSRRQAAGALTSAARS